MSLSRGHPTIPLAPKGASEQLAMSCPCAAAARDLPTKTTLEQKGGEGRAQVASPPAAVYQRVSAKLDGTVATSGSSTTPESLDTTQGASALRAVATLEPSSGVARAETMLEPSSGVAEAEGGGVSIGAQRPAAARPGQKSEPPGSVALSVHDPKMEGGGVALGAQRHPVAYQGPKSVHWYDLEEPPADDAPWEAEHDSGPTSTWIAGIETNIGRDRTRHGEGSDVPADREDRKRRTLSRVSPAIPLALKEVDDQLASSGPGATTAREAPTETALGQSSGRAETKGEGGVLGAQSPPAACRTPEAKQSATSKTHDEAPGDAVEGEAVDRRPPRLRSAARRSASKASEAPHPAPKPARPPKPKGSTTPGVAANLGNAQTVCRPASRGYDAVPASKRGRPAASGEIPSPVVVEPEPAECTAPSTEAEALEHEERPDGTSEAKQWALRKALEEAPGDGVEGKAVDRRPPRPRPAPKSTRPPKGAGEQLASSGSGATAARDAPAEMALEPSSGGAETEGGNGALGAQRPPAAYHEPKTVRWHDLECQRTDNGDLPSPVAVDGETPKGSDAPSATAAALMPREEPDAQTALGCRRTAEALPDARAALGCPIAAKAQLDSEERIAVPIGPRKSDRGAPPLDAVGTELLPYRAGLTRFPPWAGGVQPKLRVRLPRTHDAAARRNARRQEQHELLHGDRSAPKLDYELVDPREGIASSTSVEEIMRAAPGYGEELDDLRARLELPIANCSLSRAMHDFYLEDHLASMCQLCAAPVEPDEERLAGFHCGCWALRFYVNGTRGCRLEVGEVPPEPVVKRNYDSLAEHPRSTAAGFMKHYRAGAFGPPRVAARRPLRTKHGSPFSERTYRQAMPKSVASSVFPDRCAPLGAAVRYADRLKAELLGIEPKARIIYDLTKVRINAATFGGRRWRFRYAGLEALMPFLRKGGYCASFDLAAFYCQIPVDEQTSHYFAAEVPPLSPEQRAEMGIEGPGPHFVRYRSLPMGWNASCAHASAFSAAICEEAMRRGANVAVSYIDDIAIAGDTYEECLRSQEIVRKVIEERFGLLLNAEKTERPQKLLEWIGIAIDTEREQFCISPTRSKRMVDEIRGLLKEARPTVAKTRSCLGRLSWLSMIMRGARAYSSPLFGAIKGRAREERVLLSPRDRLDLQWFVQQLEDKEWRGSLWLTPATEVSYAKSDAGDDAVFLVSEGRFLYHRLTGEERLLSSHARELLPAVLAARAFGPEWKGRYVAFAFDNSGTAFSVSSGSSRDAGARDMLRMVADATVAHDFAMVGLWTQRAANVLNDAGSKVRVEKWSTEPVRIDYAADEMAASVLDVGQGCWLYPRFRDRESDVVLGYIQGDRHWC